MQDSIAHDTIQHSQAIQAAKLFRDQSKSIEAQAAGCLIIHLDDAIFKKILTLNVRQKMTDQHDTVVLLLDTQHLNKWRRLLTFVLRQLSVIGISFKLKKSGIKVQGSYALYPDLDDAQLVYQRRTRASRYAEKHLLNAGAGFHNQVLDRVLSLVFRCSPAVEVVAVVGKVQ